MPSTLIVYATTDGQTRKISERIQQTLRASGLETTLVDVGTASALDPAGFDGVIAGASVRYGKHDPAMARFLDGNRDAINRVPNAFFSVNLIARKPEKRNLEGNKYLRKFLERLSFRPMHVEIIAGKLDYPSYRFIDRIMIQMIMKITDGPTDGKSVIEYTDWDQVDEFARRMAEAIASSNESARQSENSDAADPDQPGKQGN
ncbi:MAG: menaquinone-dependent protoporphyrinogen IX dehydrogenase [Xanthomonadales bacterium]|nr:menaquinone-dependent protoporphyrinogen IX dehydrogenase [Xanthomonadales bacterium]|tara:strand:- start:982 stop:1590 length:609 start_codon:yes stop_codon:yes gene_type:complete